MTDKNSNYSLSETEKQRIARYLAREQELRQMLQANAQVINDLVDQIMEAKGVSGQTHVLNLQTMAIMPREQISETANPEVATR